MDPEMKRYRAAQAKAYLQHIRMLCLRIRELNAEIDTQREIATGITGIDYTRGAPSQKSSQDKMPDAVAKLISLISQACADLAECTEEQEEAAACLDRMGGLAAATLKLRYLLAMSWQQVGSTLHYSKEYVKHIERDALCEFYDYMPHRCRDPRHPAT